ncbi:MAG: hypothetical protein A2Y88_05995 [Chloroflexi bacterium RBG_13_48_10]|nr:MAG: hypothetical protein A2Y88_05995 [Chloroflexi bacterium RBG_13_48_10]
MRLERVAEIIWAIALICLPLTSFPLFSSISGAIVAPFSILPIFILLIIWSIPLVLRKGELPKETIPLVIFTFAVIISCASAYFFFIPGFKGKTIPGQELRALFTLAVGLSFYLVTTTWVKTTGKLHNTWKYITIGGILSLLWTGLQALYILRGAEQYPSWMDLIQSWLAVLSPQYSPRYGRVNGLTYEASWFAHQMVMLYLPLWLAASYHKTSAFALRVFHISVENILLVFGLAAFFLSSPRIGLVSLLLMVFYLFLRLNLSIHHKIVEFVTSRQFIVQHGLSQARRTWIQLLTSISIVMVYIVVLIGVFFFAVQRDWRLNILVTEPPSFKEIVGVLTLDQNTILSLSHRFIFLERTVYWFSGWNVFNQYPWLGVGLGNAGFFFPKLAPAIGWATFEIRNVLFYLTQLPNVKSFWFRLLAETGLVGFSIFITWLYVLFQSSKFSQRNPSRTIKTFALAGQLALLAFIGEGLSIDSFAMPYLWVIAGLIAAISMIYRHENASLID